MKVNYKIFELKKQQAKERITKFTNLKIRKPLITIHNLKQL